MGRGAVGGNWRGRWENGVEVIRMAARQKVEFMENRLVQAFFGSKKKQGSGFNMAVDVEIFID